MKNVLRAYFLVLAVFAGFAEIQSPHSLRLAVDGAYYLYSAPRADTSGAGSFRPLSGPLSGLELRSTLMYDYALSTPLGTHDLVKNSTLKFGTGFEVSPVSIEPFVKISFTPVPFLIFDAGFAGGTGWDFSPLNVQGLALYDYNGTAKDAYKTYDPFTQFRYRAWFEGVFQFDLAAVIPGEWTHIVAVATYKALYEAVAGAENRPWIWQGRGSTNEEKTNGWHYYSTVVLGYQMPLVLQMIGIQAEFWGNYSASSYAAEFQRWNPTFMTVTVSPIINIQITKKQSLVIQLRFASRRSYNESYDSRNDASLWVIANRPTMRQIGRDWFFDRIALSYSIRF